MWALAVTAPTLRRPKRRSKPWPTVKASSRLRKRSRRHRTPCSTARAAAPHISARPCTRPWRSKFAATSSGAGAGRHRDRPSYFQLRRVRELVGEISDGPGVDLALVPLLEDREVRGARLKILAALPAVTCKIVRGRGQHVGHVVQEVAPAIAVEIDGIFDPGRWHELGLAKFARQAPRISCAERSPRSMIRSASISSLRNS